MLQSVPGQTRAELPAGQPAQPQIQPHDARSAALALLSLHGGWLGIKGYKVGSFIVINGLVGAQRSTCQLYLPCVASCQPSLLAS